MKPHEFKVNGSPFLIYVVGNSAVVEPSNLWLQDSVDDMMFDIGEYDSEYLKEICQDNSSNYPLSALG